MFVDERERYELPGEQLHFVDLDQIPDSTGGDDVATANYPSCSGLEPGDISFFITQNCHG